MSGSADHLLRLIYEWLEEAKECSSNLRALARELESLREDCNTWETVGNTVAVAGSVLSIGAAFFTGGASLALLGAVGGGLGAGVSVVTKITEQFKSSSKLDRVKKIDKRCNTITDKIKDLFDELRKDCPSSKADEQDQYVVNEFLKAMLRRSGQDGQIGVKDLDDLIRDLMDNALVKSITKRLAVSLINEVLSILSAFAFQLEGKLLSAVAAKGGEQIGKAVAIRGASRFLGGVVGLAFSLPEAIDNWTKAIKNKHETKASKSLRDTATKIDETAADLSHKLEEIKKMMKKAVENHTSNSSSQKSNTSQNKSSDEYLDWNKPSLFRRPKPSETHPAPGPPDPPRDNESSESASESDSSSSSSSSTSSESSYEEVELNMAVLNARSVNKFVKTGDATVKNLILDNNLDVLMISETWLPKEKPVNDDFVKILPSKYKVLNVPRFYGRGGGVAIVHSDAFECYRVIYTFTIRFEYVAAVLSRPCAVNSILILNVYRRPAQTVLEFLYELDQLLSIIYSDYSSVIIGGDFNIWVDCRRRRATQAFQNLLDGVNLVQHVLRPTHRRGHILDLVLARPNVRITGLAVRPNSFSDHSTVFFTVHYLSQSAIRSLRSLLRQEAKKRRREQKKDKRRR